MTPGPMNSRGGPSKFGRKNSRNFGENLFFFGDHLIWAGKTVEISAKTFFFGDHLISAGGPSNLRGPITSYLSSRGGPSHHT